MFATKTTNTHKKCNNIKINAVKPKIAWAVKTIAPINLIVIHTPHASELTPRKKTTMCHVSNCADFRPHHIAVEYKINARVKKRVAVIISIGIVEQLATYCSKP